MIQADNANMSLIRHDIKNHLFALKSLYEKGESDSFKTYFDSILSKIDKEEELCKSGNIIVDSIINYIRGSRSILLSFIHYGYRKT